MSRALRGQALNEYVIIIVLIALASLGALVLLGDRLVTIFDQTLKPFQGPVAAMYADAFDGNGNGLAVHLGRLACEGRAHGWKLPLEQSRRRPPRPRLHFLHGCANAQAW